MSLLTELFEDGCFHLTWFIIIVSPIACVYNILHIIVNDEFFSQNMILTIILTVLYSFACYLLTTSRICALRRKPHAKEKTIEELWDTDLEFENEAEEAPYCKFSFHYKDLGETLKNVLFKNPYKFSRFRPAYGVCLVTGFVFLFASIIALMHSKEWNESHDLFCVALELFFASSLLIFSNYFLANSGVYNTEKDLDRYAPFQEHVEVPVKVIIGKTIAVFLTAGFTHTLIVVFTISIIILSAVSSNYLYQSSSVDDILKSILPPLFPNPRRLLTFLLVASSVSCLHLLIGIMMTSFIQANKNILGIIEKNWQQNLIAIHYLLPDVEAETLQDLKDYLDDKKNQPRTVKENAVLDYIEWPIYRTKQPFMGRWPDAELVPETEDLERQQPDVLEPAELVHDVQPDQAAEPEQIEPLLAEQDIAPLAQQMEPMHVPIEEQMESLLAEQSGEAPAAVEMQPSTSGITRRKKVELFDIRDSPAGAAKIRHKTIKTKAGTSTSKRATSSQLHSKKDT